MRFNSHFMKAGVCGRNLPSKFLPLVLGPQVQLVLILKNLHSEQSLRLLRSLRQAARNSAELSDPLLVCEATSAEVDRVMSAEWPQARCVVDFPGMWRRSLPASVWTLENYGTERLLAQAKAIANGKGDQTNIFLLLLGREILWAHQPVDEWDIPDRRGLRRFNRLIRYRGQAFPSGSDRFGLDETG